jgi:PAS domain S-box-containing protein
MQSHDAGYPPSIGQRNPIDDVEPLDMLALIRASHAISGRIVLDQLLDTALRQVIENSGAQRACLILVQGGQWSLAAEANLSQSGVNVSFLAEGEVSSAVAPASILDTVCQSQEVVILGNAAEPNPFSADDYIARQQPKSVVCLPLVRQAEVTGLLYLENNLLPQAFTPGRVAGLELLAAQMTISLENARLYTGLKQAEDRSRYVALATRDAIYDWDIPANVVWRNEAYQTLYAPNEPVGADETWWEQHLHPDDRGRILESIGRAFRDSNRFWTGEYRFRQFDGRYAAVMDRGYILYDLAGQPIRMIGAITNITELRQAEEERQTRQHYLALLNDITRAALETPDFATMLQALADQSGRLFNADVANIALWDETLQRTIPSATSAHELREAFLALRLEPDEPTITAAVLAAGRALAVEDIANSPYFRIAARFPFRSILGLPLIAGRQKLGAVLIAFYQPHHFTPDDIVRGEQAAGVLALAVAKAKLLDELERRVADRTDELVKANAALQAEIAERQHLEETLAAERNLLRTLIDTIPDEIYIKDAQLRFLMANATVAQVFGLERPEMLIGKTDLELWPHEAAMSDYLAEQAVLQSGQPMINRETSNPDQTRWRLESKIPLRDSQGQIIGLVGLNRFITDRKQAEAELRKYQDHLEELVAARTAELTAANARLQQEIADRRRAEEALRLSVDREQRRREWLEKVLELSVKVSGVTDLQTCLLTIYNNVRYGLDFDRVGVHLYDSATNILHGTYGTSRTGEAIETSWYAEVFTGGETAQRLLRDPKAFFFSPDYTAEHHVPPEREMYGVKEHATAAAWAGDKPVALISVDNLVTGRRMTEEQLEALRLFTSYVGFAIENARWYAAAHRELDERKQAEAALRASDERYRALYRDNPSMFFTLDVNGTVLSVNAFGASQLGYTIAELEGQSVLTVFHPADRPAVTAQLRACLQNPNQVFRWQLRKVRKDGSRLWVEEFARVVTAPDGSLHVFIVCHDITERKRAEDEVQARERFLTLLNDITRAALETSDFKEMLQILADRLSELFQADAASLALWDNATQTTLPIATSAHEFRNQYLSMRLAPGELTLPALILHLGHTLAVSDLLYSPYAQLRAAARFPFRAMLGLPLIAGAQQLGAALITFYAPHRFTPEDIERGEQTARLVALALAKANLLDQLEQRVAERTRELADANQELEAFSYSVSHDLRAPLRAIDGFSRLVLDHYGAPLPVEAQHYLQRVRAGAQHMEQLIDDLLAFSHSGRQPVRKRAVAMTDLVRQTLDELRAEHEGRSVDVQLEDLPAGEADPALLKQVWVNLLTNAFKYTRGRAAARVEIGALAGAAGPIYFVRDNGAGFDMRYAHKLFGVFQRLHTGEEFEGTGVGLAIVQRILHRHGGRIWAEAEVDNGATFYFTL